MFDPRWGLPVGDPWCVTNGGEPQWVTPGGGITVMDPRGDTGERQSVQDPRCCIPGVGSPVLDPRSWTTGGVHAVREPRWLTTVVGPPDGNPR